MMSVWGTDADGDSNLDPSFAEFVFWGTVGDAVVGKAASDLVSSSTHTANTIPNEIQALVGRNYVFTVDISADSLDKEYYVFHVQSCEPLSGASIPYALDIVAPAEQTTSSSQKSLGLVGNAEKTIQVACRGEQSVFTPPSNVLRSLDSSQGGSSGGGEKKRKIELASDAELKKGVPRGSASKGSVAKELVFPEN